MVVAEIFAKYLSWHFNLMTSDMKSYSGIIKKAYSNTIVAHKYYNDFFLNDIFLRERENYVEEFIKELPSEGTILDLGCGNGQHSIYIAKNKPNCNVIGVDFSSTMLKYAEREKEKQKLDNLNFVCDNMLSFCQSVKLKFIGVLAIFCLTCLTPEEINNVLVSIYERLLPDGKVFIAVHEDSSAKSPALGRYEIVPEIYDESEMQYYKYFTEKEMIKYLENAKFENIDIKRLRTNRVTEINSNKICFIAQKANV